MHKKTFKLGDSRAQKKKKKWRTPNYLRGSNVNPKLKIAEGKESGHAP
jgi:hypothetical protein